MIEDIETQLNINRNQTTQKGMSLMGQISDITSKIEEDLAGIRKLVDEQDNQLLDIILENQNQTVQKDMALMDQLSDILSNVTKVEQLFLDKNADILGQMTVQEETFSLSSERFISGSDDGNKRNSDTPKKGKISI